MPFSKLICLFTVIISSTLMVCGCAVNPVTQQREIMIFSEDSEIRMGTEAHAEVIRQYGKYEDPELQRYINDIGQSLARVSHRPNLPYHYVVLDKPFINAFALPGGPFMRLSMADSAMSFPPGSIFKLMSQKFDR